jgi:hypothetical protein
VATLIESVREGAKLYCKMLEDVASRTTALWQRAMTDTCKSTNGKNGQRIRSGRKTNHGRVQMREVVGATRAEEDTAAKRIERRKRLRQHQWLRRQC